MDMENDLFPRFFDHARRHICRARIWCIEHESKGAAGEFFAEQVKNLLCSLIEVA